jgi:hypothetical protein
MASYSLLLAFSGFRYSAPDQDLGFQPRPGGENFACFFSVDSGWGMLERSGAAATVDIRAGTLTLRRLSVPLASASRVLLGSDAVDAVIRPGSNQTVVELSPPVVVEPGRPLSVVG